MHKSAITTLTVFSLFSVSTTFASDGNCLKSYGTTPNEAFRAATEALKNGQAETGSDWMKDSMQIRLLSNKVNGQFVAVSYSAEDHTDGCGLGQVRKVADEQRPKCDETRCTI